MNYFELYPGDYLKDTGRLTMLEHGAYLRLMLEYYATERPLPAGFAELYVVAVAMTSADKAAVRKVADAFFPVGEDGLRHNSRADHEVAKAQKRMSIARENGGKGGRPRKTQEEPCGLPSGFSAGFENGGFSETKTKPRRNPEKTHSGEALQTPHAIQKLPHEGLTTHPPSAAVSVDPETERWGQFEGHENPSRPLLDPVVACAIELRRAGIQVTRLDKNLGPFVAEGGQAADVVALSTMPEFRDKPPAYLTAAALRQLREAKQNPNGSTHAQHQPARRLGVADRVAANIASAVRSRADDAIDVDFVDVPG